MKTNLTVCCLICHKEFTVKGLHSHYFRMHTEEGKLHSLKCVNNLRKATEELKKITRNKVEKYNETPKRCLHCNTPIPYKSTNKFCSRSCSVTNGNQKRKESGWKMPDSAIEKLKISTNKYYLDNPLRGQYSKLVFNKCKICGKDFSSNRVSKTCSKDCDSTNHKILSQLNPNCGGQKHTQRSKITNIKNESFVSESSFEVRTSEILNSLNIYWNRPSFFWYTDTENKKRRYYPDFYLPKYDLYLDPKNDYLIKTDISKIYKTSEENNIKIVIISEKYLTEDIIKNIVMDDGNAPPRLGCRPSVLLLN